MKPHRYTTKQVIEALRSAKGMVSIAAQRLQCDPDTVQNYCKKFPTVAQAKENARTELLDLAELKLWAAVQKGESWAIAFCLRTLGRSRGFGDHLALHVTIERAAARVADQFGLRVEDVLAEAKLLLEEADHGEC